MKTTCLNFLEESPALPLCIHQTDRGIERGRDKRGGEIKEGERDRERERGGERERKKEKGETDIDKE
jgi:hypothetical protein